MGRPRRGRAVLDRRDGAEVPAPGRIGRARLTGHRVRRRAAASVGAPRSTAACTTDSRPSWPTSGAGRTASRSSRPRCSTSTRTRSRASCPCRVFRAPRHRRRPRWNAERRSSVGARSSSPACSATTAPAAARSRRWRARSSPARSTRARRSSRSAASPDCSARTTGSSARACTRTLPGGETESLTINAEHVFVCGGAIQTPTLLQHSGIRHQIGTGLKFHPTVKVAARFPRAFDHADVPMHRVTEFAPFLTIGGSASRRGHVALALADSANDYRDALGELGGRRRLLRGDPQRRQRPGHRAPRPQGPARDVPDDRCGPEPPGPRVVAPG